MKENYLLGSSSARFSSLCKLGIKSAVESLENRQTRKKKKLTGRCTSEFNACVCFFFPSIAFRSFLLGEFLRQLHANAARNTTQSH